MNRKEMGFTAEADPEESYDIKDALDRAGLFNVEPPRPGTKAYDRLIAAAEAYMNEVRRIEFARPEAPDGENYFSGRRQNSGSSDSARRRSHDELSMMLFGSLRKQLSKEDADKVSNFAAFLTGNDSYQDSW